MTEESQLLSSTLSGKYNENSLLDRTYLININVDKLNIEEDSKHINSK